MPSASDMAWFKGEFHANVATAVAGTPFDLSMITALASQETGSIWGPLRRKGQLTTQQILDVCNGDVIYETGGRRAFPRNRAQLEAHPRGSAMYALARKELAAMAAHITVYAKYIPNPERFCHGYGILQCDLQHFKTEPDYFLNRDYANIDRALARAVRELRRAQSVIPTLAGKTRLTDLELAAVAIAYNTGGFKPGRGLKQGHQDKTTLRFYGEYFYEYLQAARTVPDPSGVEVAKPKPPAGQAPVAAPSPITATGPVYRVETQIGRLNLRKTADASSDDNIDERLPDGHLVQSFGEPLKNGFLRVQTNVNGARVEGFVSPKFLVQQGPAVAVPVVTAAPKPPAKGAVAVYLPVGPNTKVVRTSPATAGSLNEPGQPVRKGTTPAQRVAEIAAIIDWLGVEKASHKRYQPAGGKTFCNIYAHDFCTLAGVYVPRVWWMEKALVELGKGVKVEPLYGKTIREMTANDLLNWLDEFGPDFGWRRTSSLSQLQAEANQGAIGLVVARTKSGSPGHIAIAVPETAAAKARRDAAGEVSSPVLSQAGAANSARGVGRTWWTDAKYAGHAYWLHG